MWCIDDEYALGSEQLYELLFDGQCCLESCIWYTSLLIRNFLKKLEVSFNLLSRPNDFEYFVPTHEANPIGCINCETCLNRSEDGTNNKKKCT